jgi:hypothetical protein
MGTKQIVRITLLLQCTNITEQHQLKAQQKRQIESTSSGFRERHFLVRNAEGHPAHTSVLSWSCANAEMCVTRTKLSGEWVCLVWLLTRSQRYARRRDKPVMRQQRRAMGYYYYFTVYGNGYIALHTHYSANEWRRFSEEPRRVKNGIRIGRAAQKHLWSPSANCSQGNWELLLCLATALRLVNVASTNLDDEKLLLHGRVCLVQFTLYAIDISLFPFGLESLELADKFSRFDNNFFRRVNPSRILDVSWLPLFLLRIRHKKKRVRNYNLHIKSFVSGWIRIL